MRGILAFVPLVIASCASSAFDRAPLKCETGSGTVRGYAVEDIEEVGRLVCDLSPRVSEILRAVHPALVRVVVVQSEADPYSGAYTQEVTRAGRMIDRFI